MKKNTLVIAIVFVCGLGALSSLQGWVQVQSGDITIQTIEPFAYFCLEHKGPFTQIQQVIARMSEEARHQNAAPAGPLMAVYHNTPEQVEAQNLEWEVGFPVTAQTLIQPPLKKKEWVYTQVAVCLHQGAYEETGETIGKMFDWLADNGYKRVGPIMERYLDMNPAELRADQRKTEIWMPCEKTL